MDVDVLAVAAGLAIGLGWFYADRRRLAVREVERWIRSGGLPDDPDARAESVLRQTRRNAAMAAGMLAGLALGVCALLLAGDRWDIWGYAIALEVAGGGAAVWFAHLRTLRSDERTSPRVASLRPRRLTDYLTTTELAAQVGMQALPLFALGCSVAVFADGDRGAGLRLLAGAVAGAAWFAVVLLAQRRALAASRPAGSELEMRWQEANRAQMLRDLLAVAMAGAWALGGLVAFGNVIDDPDRYPDAVARVVPWVLGAASVVMVLVLLAGAWALSRSQRRYDASGAR
jgi:uncharacterized membrane protein